MDLVCRFEFWGPGFGFWAPVYCCGGQGVGFTWLSVASVQDLGRRVSNFGFRVPGFGLRFSGVGVSHSGDNPGANLESIAQGCHPILVAFAWKLTKETINLSLGCLQGGM